MNVFPENFLKNAISYFNINHIFSHSISLIYKVLHRLFPNLIESVLFELYFRFGQNFDDINLFIQRCNGNTRLIFIQNNRF